MLFLLLFFGGDFAFALYVIYCAWSSTGEELENLRRDMID